MDRNIKNKGREKHVTSGGGNASRREKAGAKRPAGTSAKYSGREKSGSSSSSSGGSSGNYSGSGLGGLFGSSSSSGKNPSGGLNLKKIIIWGIIILVGFLILRSCMGSGGNSPGLLSGLTDSFDSNYTSDSTYASSGSGVSNTNYDSLDTSVSNLARGKRTTILGGGQDTVTVMIYMLGSDLESSGGMATRDLQEILNADIADNVNIIVETGGATKWQNSVISADTNQRYQCVNGGLKLLQDNLGIRTMTDPNTLTDFITYCKTNFPANRYMLVMWDHGGGSAAGYGHDEYAPNDTMTLDEIHSALTKANVDFDLIGFDACLMATYETAVMLEQHADYMIASEETEPGIGWYYTGWVNALSDNTSISTAKLGQILIDDFTEKCYENSAREQTTLSIIDLAEFAGTVPEAFNAFAASTGDMIEADAYDTIAEARSDTREFGQPARLDQIDLVHLAKNIGTDEANAL
ncbi:MAG: clostripain-related cysteine peptidase, partial [Eubacteriales bacterium]